MPQPTSCTSADEPSTFAADGSPFRSLKLSHKELTAQVIGTHMLLVGLQQHSRRVSTIAHALHLLQSCCNCLTSVACWQYLDARPATTYRDSRRYQPCTIQTEHVQHLVAITYTHSTMTLQSALNSVSGNAPCGSSAQVPGVLSVTEAQKFIDVAEQQGFQHQSSRGPAFGEAFR